MKNFLCIIPIRAGSSAIKNKNIKLINGKPLAYYAIKKAYESNVFGKIIVATDSQRYIKILKKFLPNKKIHFFNRSQKSATNKAKSEIVLNEVITKYENFQYICMIQVTSPFLSSRHIIEAKKKFLKSKFDSLFSCYISHEWLWKQDKNRLNSLNYNYEKRPQRQNFNKVIFENGALYFFKRNGFIKHKNRLFRKIGFYEMSKKDSLDINFPSDLNYLKKK